MAAPVVIQILDAIQARLALISTTGGYFTTVGKLRRATLQPFKDDDLPALNFWPGVDSVTARGAGWVEHQLTVFIEYYTRTRDRAFSDVVFELVEDVETVIHRATDAAAVTDDPDLTLSGLVHKIQLQSATPQVGEGQTPWCGALLSYNVTYRVSAGKPATQVVPGSDLPQP